MNERKTKAEERAVHQQEMQRVAYVAKLRTEAEKLRASGDDKTAAQKEALADRIESETT